MIKLLAATLIAALPFAAHAHSADDWIVPGEIAEENGATLAINRATLMMLGGKHLVEIQMVDGIAAVGTYYATTRVTVDCKQKSAVPVDYTYVNRQTMAYNYEDARKFWPVAGPIFPKDLSPTAQKHIQLAVCPDGDNLRVAQPGYKYKNQQSFRSFEELMARRFGQAHWANPRVAFEHAEHIVSANEHLVHRVSAAIDAVGSSCSDQRSRFNGFIAKRERMLSTLRNEASGPVSMRPYETKFGSAHVHDEIVSATKRAILIAETCGIEIEGLPAQGVMIPDELLPSSRQPTAAIGMDQAPDVSPVGRLGMDAR